MMRMLSSWFVVFFLFAFVFYIHQQVWRSVVDDLNEIQFAFKTHTIHENYKWKIILAAIISLRFHNKYTVNWKWFRNNSSYYL